MGAFHLMPDENRLAFLFSAAGTHATMMDAST
jgi:hypothetical protein